ncbi:MAG TPA: zf-HC2 domain-containing protein [Trebonia sp.]|nr:zf-HC2 domain-containing protein [Trebonia sp.]
MQCDRFREAISARIDGEDPGLPDGALDAHLEACADCRAWQQQAHAVTRRARLGGSFLDHDLTSLVLAAAPAAAIGRRRRLTLRAGLAVIAAVQLAITVPLLLLGHDHDAGAHAAHELGSFDLSLAIAFAVGAIRPALAAGLAWPCAIAAAGLTGTAVVDLIGGQALGADEAQHLIAIAGALLLIWQARANDRRSASGTADASRTGVGTGLVPPAPVTPGRHPAASAGGPPGSPGGEASALPVPGVTARTRDDAALSGGHGEGGTPTDSGTAVA